MSQKRIEKKFQSALKDYSSIIDDDQLWLEIEDSVPKKKKKRRLLMWLSFGASAMAMVLLFFWMIPDNKLSTQDDRIKVDNTKSENIITQKTNVSKLPKAKSDSQDQKLDSNINYNELINLKSQNIAPTEDSFLKSKTAAIHHKSDLVSSGNENKLDIENKQKRKEIKVPRLNTFPIISELFITNKDIEAKIKTKKQKRVRPNKASEKTRSNITLNYYAGTMYSKQNRSSQDAKYVNFGEDYFSQGLSLSYNRFIGSKLYGRVILSVDRSYKKYADQVARDTLVESSLGSQVLSYTEFGNGIIDTESGIPIVKGTYNRDVLSLNALTSISAGLGIGYEQSIGKWNVNLEADFQKSFYYALSGFGKQDAEEIIRNLDSFENYFSYDSKYTVNSQLNLGFAISKSISVSAGLQYQLGLTSILIDQTKHSEKINLLRASIGLKKEL